VAINTNTSTMSKKPHTALNYSLLWIVNGVTKETILQNVSKPLCLWKKEQLENSTHKTGLLMIKPNK